MILRAASAASLHFCFSSTRSTAETRRREASLRWIGEHPRVPAPHVDDLLRRVTRILASRGPRERGEMQMLLVQKNDIEVIAQLHATNKSQQFVRRRVP